MSPMYGALKAIMVYLQGQGDIVVSWDGTNSNYCLNIGGRKVHRVTQYPRPPSEPSWSDIDDGNYRYIGGGVMLRLEWFIDDSGADLMMSNWNDFSHITRREAVIRGARFFDLADPECFDQIANVAREGL